MTFMLSERITVLCLRIKMLFRRRKRTQADFSEELQAHLALEADRLRGEGMNEKEASAMAQRNLGNITKTKEQFYESHRWLWLDTLLQDLRYGLRTLRRSPGLTAIAVLSLALGIGANTAIFSLMNAVMLRELPVNKPNQLVLLGDGRAGGSTDDFANTRLYSYLFYHDLRQKNQVFSKVSAVLSLMFGKMHGAVGGSANLEQMDVQLVSGAYFPMLGVNPILGRAFTEADDEPAGGHPIAIISYSWWERRFARDPAILGKTVRLGSTIYTIIGVTPPEFFGTTVGQSPDLWIPLSMEKQVSPGWNGLDDKWFESLYVLGRLKPGVTVAQAEANVNLLARQIWHGFKGPVLTSDEQQTLEHAHIELTPAARGLSRLRSRYSLPLQILMIIVGLVLLIACANIANLLLARATTRQREIAVRMAIGAGRARLIRQMLTESLLIAFFGGALGIVLAWWASEGLLAMVSAGPQPLPLNVAPDARVLIFTFVVTVFTSLLFGTIPALRATRIDLTPALKEGRGAASVTGRNSLSKALIVSQVALSLVLLIGAGLFLRTLVNLSNVNTGFNKENVLLFGIDPADVGYKEDARLVSLYQQIEQRVSTEPGVRAASISFFTFNQGAWDGSVVVEGRPQVSGIDNDVIMNVVGPSYFTTMGIPLLTGRVFDLHDTANSPKVAIINQTMAREFFPGGSPIGRRFGLDPKHSADIEVVGVVEDAKYLSVQEKQWSAAYYPYTQRPAYYNDFEVRYSGDSGAIIAEVRRAVGEVDRRLPISYRNTLTQQVDQSVASQTLVARLSAFFGLLAVFLACIGIYGLMSYAVTRRTSEIGIRVALGAGRSNVLWMVIRESLALVVIGLAVGLPVALAADRLVSRMLFGLKPADPFCIAGAGLILLAFAALAGYLPARRAAKVDPMIALRYE
ncbi:MAG TPA: ABC transporter permease [Terriglobia bacterium]|nr:ABC transporter permease [Terriglobia bacterium]